MPRGDVYRRNPRAWFALRDRLRAAGRWYGDRQATGEPQQQVQRTSEQSDVHNTGATPAITTPSVISGELCQTSFIDLLEGPDWGIEPYKDPNRQSNLDTSFSRYVADQTQQYWTWYSPG